LITALALGIPALLREGMTWRDIRSAGAGEQAAARGMAVSADQ
jgi:hypothetical protein